MISRLTERLTLAKQSLDEGKLLLREKMGNKLVLTKLYHAQMNCLFALFDIRDAAKLTHADLIDRFEREYVRTGKIDHVVLDVLRRAYGLTHECDHMQVPTDGEIASAMKAAEELISAAEGLLGTEVRKHESSAV